MPPHRKEVLSEERESPRPKLEALLHMQDSHGRSPNRPPGRLPGAGIPAVMGGRDEFFLALVLLEPQLGCLRFHPQDWECSLTR